MVVVVVARGGLTRFGACGNTGDVLQRGHCPNVTCHTPRLRSRHDATTCQHERKNSVDETQGSSKASSRAFEAQDK